LDKSKALDSTANITNIIQKGGTSNHKAAKIKDDFQAELDEMKKFQQDFEQKCAQGLPKVQQTYQDYVEEEEVAP